MAIMPRVKEPVILTPEDPRWLAFMASMPEANIFHHPAWLDLLSRSYGYRPFVAALLNENGGIDAGLPVMEVNSRLRGRRWVSLPFTDHCAPLASSLESEQTLIKQLVELSRNQGVQRIQVRWSLPPALGLQAGETFLWHRIALDAKAPSTMVGVSRMHRRNVRLAQRRGVRIEWSDDPGHLKDFYKLHVLNRQRLGVPVQPWRFFDLLGKLLISRGLGFLLLAYHDQECIAGAVFLRWGKTLVYKYGASSRQNLHFRPNDLIFWMALEWACANGYERLDLGRTDVADEGLGHFKKGWGAREQQLSYSTLPSLQHPVGSSSDALGLIRKFVRHSPSWVARLSGELFYRYLA